MSNYGVKTTEQFLAMDLGTPGPIPARQDEILVEINTGPLVAAYARSFIQEANRINHKLVETTGLTEEEMLDYANFLFTQRVLHVQGKCDLWRKLKPLYIPSYIQYVLSMIGRVFIRSHGLKLEPTMKKLSKMSIDQAYVISEKIGAFERVMQIVQDAMPRDEAGHQDVMTTALIADHVRALNPVTHPGATYVTAFADMRLQREADFAVLYRVQYDDLHHIASVLTTQRGLYAVNQGVM